MDKLDIKICWKISEVFVLAAMESYLPINFVKKWLQSEISNKIYGKDKETSGLSCEEILSLLKEECGKELYKFQIENPTDYSDLMDWAGYIFSHMIVIEKIPADDILEQFDIERIMANYDILHLFSPSRAIEEIRNEMYIFQKVLYKKEN